MQVVTPKQMAKIEEQSEKLGVSKKELMRNAGRKLADIIEDTAKRIKGGQPKDTAVVFLAGSGNNGGDCFTSANILAYRDYNVTVVNLCGKPSTELAEEAFGKMSADLIRTVTGYRNENVKSAIEAAELDYMTLSDENSISDVQDKKELSPVEQILINEKERLSEVRKAVMSADILVDGVFGTGFHGQLNKDICYIFSISTKAYKIAVDVPSGGDSGKGNVSEGIFKADETVALGYIKAGLLQYPLRRYCGKITVTDIGIPDSAVDVISGERTYIRIERNHLQGFPIARRRDSHKGDFGKVLVIAGSSSMRGAAAFAVLGALRTGAGLVTLASVEKCIDTVSVLAPEATFIEMECDDRGFMLFDYNKDEILKAMEKSTAIVIGCGMGVTNDTIELTKFVSENAKCPVIIDADGINCIANNIDILLNKNSEVIITPHPGEMSVLLSCDTRLVNENRIVTAEKYAEKYGITVVLKGAATLVANSNVTASNHTGNAGMSKGGSGDILAGIIGAIAGQGYSPVYSCCAGVYIHGLAGDAAAEKFGQEAMLPRDTLDCIPDAFRILKEKNK